MAEENGQALFHRNGTLICLRQHLQGEILTFHPEQIPVLPGEHLPELLKLRQMGLSAQDQLPVVLVHSKLSIRQTEDLFRMQLKEQIRATFQHQGIQQTSDPNIKVQAEHIHQVTVTRG